jgi:hypothetical protein
MILPVTAQATGGICMPCKKNRGGKTFGPGIGKLGDLGRFLSGKMPLPSSERTEWLELCTIEVTSGKLWIGDPLIANEEDGCVATVPAGTYTVEGIGCLSDRTRTVCSVRAKLKSTASFQVGAEIGETGTDCANLCALARFRVPVIEHHHARAEMTVRIDAFVSARRARLRIHAGGGPPQAAAPHAIGFRHAIADDDILGGIDDAGAFEPGARLKTEAVNDQVIAGVWVDAEKISIHAVTDIVAIEFPLPANAIVEPPFFQTGATKKIRVALAIAHDGGAPPVAQRRSGICGAFHRVCRSACHRRTNWEDAFHRGQSNCRGCSEPAYPRCHRRRGAWR